MTTKDLVIRFERGLNCLALLDHQRLTLTINTDWWSTLSVDQQKGVIAHEVAHLDNMEQWIKWATDYHGR